MARRIAFLGLVLVVLVSMLPDVGSVSSQGDGTPVADEPLQPELEETPAPDASPNSIARQIDDNDPTDPDLFPHGRIDFTAYRCLQQGFELPDEVAEFDVGDPGTGGDDAVVGALPDEVYIEDEFAGCTPDYTGVTFSIAVRNQQTREQTAVSTGYPAVASFPTAFAEPLYLMSPSPANFRRDPVVVCTSSLHGPMRFEGAASDYGIVQYELAEAETLTCAWYFIQLQAPGTIAITVRFCLQDGLRPDDHQALQAACTDVYDRLAFTATPQGASQGLDEDMTNDGSVRYDDVSPGAWVVTQVPRGIFDAPAVFCRSTIDGQPGVSRWFAQDTFGEPANSVTINVPADGTVSCQWYVAKNGFLRFMEGNTLLGMTFAGCPDSFDPATSSIYDFAQFCHEPLPPITATIAQSSGATMTATGASTDFNFLEFDFILGAPVTVTVDVVEGYTRVIPFCDPRLDGIPGNSDTNPEPVSGAEMNVFTVELLPDLPQITSASCSVYYILPQVTDPDDAVAPAGDNEAAKVADGSLIITVHGCPLGTKADTNLAGVCADPVADVTFTALSTADEHIQATSAGEVIASASFDRLATGTWTIAQGEVDGFRDTVVTCNGVTTVATNGTVSVTVAPGETMVCDWYLLPGIRIQGN